MTWYREDGDWTRADKRLFTVRVIPLWITLGIVMVVFVALSFLVATPWIIGTFVTFALGLWSTYLVHRNVSAHAWWEREDDLVIRRGRLYRSVTVVPYGRMQYVEVSAGPLDRAFGIATIQLHTASSDTGATLNGVPAEKADHLRDALTARGEARLAGL